MVTSDAAGGVHRLGSSSPWSIQPGDHRQQIRLLLRDGRHRPGHGCCRGRHRGAGGTGPPRSWLPPGRPSRPWSKPRSFNQNVDDFAAINAVYARYMPEPARSAPANVNLPPGLLISIGAVPVRGRVGAAPDIGQFQNNPMRPDRHWSRAAHVGQRAGQVPAPQLVFGAVGVRRRGVAVTGSSTDGLCVWRPAPGVVRFARRCRGCRYWSLRWCGTAFPVPRRFGGSPSGVDLVASAALSLSL